MLEKNSFWSQAIKRESLTLSSKRELIRLTLVSSPDILLKGWPPEVTSRSERGSLKSDLMYKGEKQDMNSLGQGT